MVFLLGRVACTGPIAQLCAYKRFHENGKIICYFFNSVMHIQDVAYKPFVLNFLELMAERLHPRNASEAFQTRHQVQPKSRPPKEPGVFPRGMDLLGNLR
jgi:hypothetical protein